MVVSFPVDVGVFDVKYIICFKCTAHSFTCACFGFSVHLDHEMEYTIFELNELVHSTCMGVLSNVL